MDWIPVGKITRTHGLKGELKFYPLFTDRDIHQHFSHVFLGEDEDSVRPMVLERVRSQGSRLIIKIKGCNSIDAAQEFVGQTLSVHRKDFKSLPEGEYYWFEIEGLQVYDEQGRYHGAITEIIQTGSNDVYVVQDQGRELLLPMIDSVVKSIDLNQQKLVFHIIEGLLEDHSV